MPIVEGKHFPYTKSGKAAAKRAALKKMVSSKGKSDGDSGKYSFLKKFGKK